jgi:hypothetical protein
MRELFPELIIFFTSVQVTLITFNTHDPNVTSAVSLHYFICECPGILDGR